VQPVNHPALSSLARDWSHDSNGLCFPSASLSMWHWSSVILKIYIIIHHVSFLVYDARFSQFSKIKILVISQTKCPLYLNYIMYIYINIITLLVPPSGFLRFGPERDDNSRTLRPSWACGRARSRQSYLWSRRRCRACKPCRRRSLRRGSGARVSATRQSPGSIKARDWSHDSHGLSIFTLSHSPCSNLYCNTSCIFPCLLC
jgi:hypothetical protein